MSPSDPSGEELCVRGLRRSYPDFHLGPIDLTLRRGETLVVLGPNGSGKSTFLRVLAGLEPMDSGEVHLGGRNIGALPPHQRGIGMVFQDLALFPTRSVWDNITYGLVVQRWPRSEADARGEELLGQFRLSELADRRPGELSGGERQRVALARALAPRPSLLLLDEPLSSADPRIARDLRAEIKSVLRAADTPAVYVTHDLDEGFFLGDRVALLDQGTWVQEGRTTEVFDRPATPFAAWFLGYNVLPNPTVADSSLAFLPDAVEVVPAGGGSLLEGVVESLGDTGSQVRLFARVASPGGTDEGSLVEVLRPRGMASSLPSIGSRVGLSPTRPLELRGAWPPAGFKKGRGSGEGGVP